MKPSSQLSRSHLKELNRELDRLQAGATDPQDVLLDNADFMQQFRITRRTAYNWRKKGLLPFLLIEQRVFFRLSDIREFLKKQEVR